MQVELPDLETRATILIRAERPMDDDEYFEFCAKNSELHIEREANGEIIIMPPTGFETGYRNNEVSGQLRNWARVDGRGIALDSNTEYVLPNGAARAPDASWVLKGRLAVFTKDQKKRFLPICPDFVIELMSPTDRLRGVKAKMREWMENGAALGWLIDPDARTVHVYRPHREPEALADIDHLEGEGPVAGFRLELSDIWRGL
ncbi:MAG TPA: Uma2 family endonuclease [Bryobacteraceae bacterium]|nr:Uma2 family endonuclease [Bryobacteraceae bacterium]